MSKIILSTLLLISTAFFLNACSKNKTEIKKQYKRSSANYEKEKKAYQDLDTELKK